MKRALLFLNGGMSPSADKNILPPSPFFSICADGGVRHAMRFGITPNIILGDFDSLPSGTREQFSGREIEWISHPPDKDQYETDSELALRTAKERGVTELTIYGYSGNRLDHMTANLFLFSRFAKDMSISIEEAQQRLIFISAQKTWEGAVGDTISLIPLTETVEGVTTKGLTYPLSHARLDMGTTLGISNTMKEKTASASITSGCLLLIHIR